MRQTTLTIVSLLSLVGYAAIANAELSAIERERLRLCPKNCAAYCEEIPGKPTYCTCFCHAPERMIGLIITHKRQSTKRTRPNL
jgi:hypothetical protein